MKILLILLFSIQAMAISKREMDVLHLLPQGVYSDIAVEEGHFYFDSTSHLPKFYNGSAWKTVQDTDSAQTVSTKTLDNTNTANLKDNLLTIQDDGGATKQFQIQASSITAGQTRKMTIPDFDFTPATLGGTETWSGAKTMLDSSLALADNADTTKKGNFELSGVTAGQNRAMLWPNVDNWVPVITAGDQTIAGDKGFTGNPFVSRATPSWDLKDSNAADADVNAQVSANATTTTSGAEVVDMFFGVQIAGAMSTWLSFDASVPEILGEYSFRLKAYTTAGLPSGSSVGSIAYDSTRGVIVHKNATGWVAAVVCGGLVFSSAGVPSVSAEYSSDGVDCFGSVTDTATGRSVVAINAGVFAASPYCGCTPREDVSSNRTCGVTDTSTTAVSEVRTRAGATAALADESYYLICIGSR